MFRAVDTRRHWPKTEMTSAKWQNVGVYMVAIKDLVLTQDGVYFEPLLNPERPVGGDEYPHVVCWNGKMYLEDGHHRVVRKALDGQEFVFARILYIRD